MLDLYSLPHELVTQENVILHLGLGRELWSTGLLNGLQLYAFKYCREKSKSLAVSTKLEKML